MLGGWTIKLVRILAQVPVDEDAFNVVIFVVVLVDDAHDVTLTNVAMENSCLRPCFLVTLDIAI